MSDGTVDILPSSFSVYEDSVSPSISFTIQYKRLLNELTLDIHGFVYSEDEKFISTISLLPDTDFFINKGEHGSEGGGGLSSILKIENSNSPSQRIPIEYKAFFTLNEKHIDYIEKLRSKNVTKDVVFYIFVTIRVLRSNITTYNLGPLISKNNETDGSKNTDNPHNPINGLIVRDNNENNLLDSIEYRVKLKRNIPGNNWVYHFQEKLGLGRAFHLELPLKSNLDNVKTESDEWNSKINNANTILKEMDLDFRKGEWSNVVSNARKIFELFNKGDSTMMNKILSNFMEAKAMNQFSNGLSNIFGYFSGEHHSTEGGKVKRSIPSDSEDAYLAYMYTASFLHFITKKTQRSNT